MRRVLPLLCLAAAVSQASAATFVATSVEEVTRASRAVVRGRVLSAAGRLTPDGRRVVTDVEIAVESAWKGAPGARVQVVVPGGTTPKLGMIVDAAPTFTPGEEVVVFLGRRGAAWTVAGLAQGKYRVEGGTASPGLHGAQVLPRALRAGERATASMPVEELERRVRSAR